jgi:hypothetical protein
MEGLINQDITVTSGMTICPVLVERGGRRIVVLKEDVCSKGFGTPY